MKFVVIGDTHLGLNKASDLYHDVTYKFFRHVIGFCTANNIAQVIHLGDFFHDRKELNTKTQNVAHRIARLFENSQIMLFQITGNHDVYFKDTLDVSTLELFCKYQYITIIDKPVEYGDIIFCPWGRMPQPTTKKYCFGHFSIIGFKMNNTYMADKGNTPDEFKQFEHVYSGHFHTPSTRDNITYLGSPYGMTFHDVNSERGFYVWEDGKLDKIVYNDAPKFIIMESDKVDRTLIKGNAIKLIFKEDYGILQNQKLIEEIQALNPIKLQTDFSQIKIEGTEEKRDESAEEQIGLLDHKEIIADYIEKTEFPDHIKPSILLNMIERLREE